MDDILIEIETKNCEIESLLDKDYNFSLDDVSNINKLYVEKKDLIEKFVSERVKDHNVSLVNSNKSYWKNKFDKYLSKDKEVLDKLDEKIQYLAQSLKQNQGNKKLLIYNK
ncbi:hypothetical protein OAQ99_01540 [Candidatus Kapabacteria bacterium]|nr:hypothetical protein [Candidatus Kapabacteria bacterium]